MERKVPKNLKDTKTEKNLWKAYALECEAAIRYEFFGSQAKKDGYEQISYFFDETSGNEKEHAEMWFDFLGQMGDTVKNLKKSIQNETYESKTMYTEFAEIARLEGFDEIADKFQGVGEVEKGHAVRYKKLRQNILDGEVFEREEKVTWQCRNCGNLTKSTKAPKVCPVCGYDQAYYQLQEDNY